MMDKIKRLLAALAVAAALAPCPSFGAQDWTVLAESHSGTSYYDASTINLVSGGKVSLKVKRVYSEAFGKTYSQNQGYPSPTKYSVITQYCDCQNWAVFAAGGTDFGAKDEVLGEVPVSSFHEAQWQPAKPNTISDTLLTAVCPSREPAKGK